MERKGSINPISKIVRAKGSGKRIVEKAGKEGNTMKPGSQERIRKKISEGILLRGENTRDQKARGGKRRAKFAAQQRKGPFTASESGISSQGKGNAQSQKKCKAATTSTSRRRGERLLINRGSSLQAALRGMRNGKGRGGDGGVEKRTWEKGGSYFLWVKQPQENRF